MEIERSVPLPERPICCLKLEIVPGNPELIVASKEPISIPYRTARRSRSWDQNASKGNRQDQP